MASEKQNQDDLVNEEKSTVAPSVVIPKDNLLSAAPRLCATCRGDANVQDCPDCFGTGLGPLVHYTADATGRPTCIEPDPVTSRESKDVSCKHCLNVIFQRQNMDMGDWLE